jgi:hypothetical protein
MNELRAGGACGVQADVIGVDQELVADAAQLADQASSRP